MMGEKANPWRIPYCNIQGFVISFPDIIDWDNSVKNWNISKSPSKLYQF